MGRWQLPATSQACGQCFQASINVANIPPGSASLLSHPPAPSFPTYLAHTPPPIKGKKTRRKDAGTQVGSLINLESICQMKLGFDLRIDSSGLRSREEELELVSFFIPHMYLQELLSCVVS